MTSDLSIEMLPAGHGDALWVEWGPASDRHRLLIDGGPRKGFRELRRRFELLDENDRHVDLLIITHIDLDHIDGAVDLLRNDTLGVTFGDIWFNAYKHLDPDSSDAVSRGAIQGEFVSAVLDDQQLTWNKAFGGGAVVVNPTGSLPSVPLAHDLRLVVLSPTPEKLIKLQKTWDKTLADAKLEPGDREEALALLESKHRGETIKYGGDDSSANGSSIAVVLEYQEERWLLSGDAHEEVLLTNLARYADKLPVHLDGFKLPHHGSVRNISPELLDAIKCQRFLISTNGSYFKHPDEAAVDLVVERSSKPQLVFNYYTDFNKKWEHDSENYTSTYPDDTADDETDDGLQAEKRGDPPTTGDKSDEPITEAAATRAAVVEDTSVVDAATPAQVPTGPPIVVTVHHGSLDQADWPVVVGHYKATPLSGAEGFVDRQFDHRLSQRLERNIYVSDIGDYAYIKAPPRRLPTAGVLVVGLGEYGELTPLRLVEAVREALVRHALDQADDQPVGDSAMELGVSSVLIAATGAHGLTIAASANAIVDGVQAANRDLRGGAGPARAHYTKVQLFERNAPEAELAFLALKDDLNKRNDQDDSDHGYAPRGSASLDEVIRPTRLDIADGRLVNSLPNDGTEAPWWRIRVSENQRETDDTGPRHYLDLEFAVGGRLARSGVVSHQVERRRLERMLRNAVGKEALSSGLHTVLFELLFPNQLKWDLMAAQDIQVEVDDTTADIPWEMLEARNPKEGTRGELALRAPLIRQLRVDVTGAIARAPRKTALVIGNPPVAGLAADLPGAYAEAKAVAKVLTDKKYEVTDLCYAPNVQAEGDPTSDIESALFADDYRIIHMAAHGLLQPDDPTRTGVAIGKDDFVTAGVLGQLNVIPDLVFLNCCHVGAVQTGIQDGALDFTKRNLNRLAASLARQLIRSGVRAVVVAGWAVHDGAATCFAETFYRGMLSGETFGRAVYRARLAAMDAAPASSTWGAYQCYGDAGYRLPSSNNGSDKKSKPATRREVLRRIESLVSWVDTWYRTGGGNQSDKQWANDELTELEEPSNLEQLGVKPGEIAQEFARAWGELGMFEKAIAWYEVALTDGGGLMTLTDIEQLANLRDRRAAELLRKPEPTDDDRREAAQLFAAAFRGIEQLEQISGSGERTALRAGHHKRRAQSAPTDAERAAALGEAAAAYRASYDHEKQGYTLFNYVQLEEIRSRVSGVASAASELDVDYRAALEAGDKIVRSESNYWIAIGRPDGRLTDAIRTDSVHTSVDELAGLYTEAFESRSNWRQRRSSLDHLLDLADLHPDPLQKTALRRLYTMLSPTA